MRANELPLVACVLRAAQIPYTPRPEEGRTRARVKAEPKRKRPKMAAYMRAWRAGRTYQEEE